MRWLHLTDIHVGRTGDTEQNVAIGELLRAVQAVLAGAAVDAVIFTGDIANSGLAAQYDEFVRRLLAPLRALPECANAKFIAVPGNHDLFHDESSLPLTWESLGSSHQSLFFEESESGTRTRTIGAKRFTDYSAFVEKNSILSPDPLREVSRVFTVSDGRRTVHFLATNTAFFSHKDVSDEQRVAYPDVSIRARLQEAAAATHIFILGHHPVTWFLHRMRNTFWQLLASYKAVYLHGHLHELDTKFSSHGLVTMGFGAAYQAPLTSPAKPIYRNTFCVCELDDEVLHVAPYDWDAENGRWVPPTTLPPDFQERSTVLKDGWLLPIRRQPASPVLGLAIRALPRNTPSRIGFLGSLDHGEWLSLIDRAQLIDKEIRTEAQQATQGTRNGRPAFRFRTPAGVHYVECIGAQGHSIPPAEIQDINTLLDIEDYLSYTILTFGVLTEDAHTLYVRLREHKPITILTGNDIAQRLSQLPAFASALSKVDTSVSECEFTIATGGRILLIVRDTVGTGWFYVTDAQGEVMLATDPQVTTLRRQRPDLATTPYRSASATEPVAGPRRVFDRDAYLAACRRVFNDARYAPLAAIGLRLPDATLEELYVETRATLGQGGASSDAIRRAVDDMVRDARLDGPLAEELRVQLARQLELANEGANDSAPKFYQQFGSVSVLGDPGSGKTFFVKREILTYASQEVPSWYSRHTPLFVPLAELATRFNAQSSVLTAAAQIAETQGLPVLEADLVDLLSKGLIAFFLDGLDEIVSVELRSRMLDALRELVDSALPLGNRFILTSRPAAAHRIELPRGLEVISMRGLSDDDIRALASKLLKARVTETALAVAESKDADSIIEGLMRDVRETPGIARLAQNPLFLTLLVMIYANAGATSARRHRIYQQAVQTLVAVRTRQAGQRGLSEADLRVRLGDVAFSIFSDPRGVLPTRGALAAQIAQIMSGERSVAVAVAEASQWLQDVAESTGLLVFHARQKDDAQSLVTFMHHSFLEFYAAHGLLAPANRERLSQVARVPRWHDVLTLAAGILGETADVYPLINTVISLEEPGESLTLEFVLLAFDCILENEIPPERVMRALLSRIDERVRTGPVRRDWELRSAIGKRLGRLLTSSGSPLVSQFLIAGLSDNDEDTRAAYLDLTGHVGCHAKLDPNTVAAATRAATSKSASMQLAACSVVSRAPDLQTPTILATTIDALDGNTRVRLMALEAMNALPNLAMRAWDQLARIVTQGNAPHAEIAARAILRAGFKIDPEEGDFSRLVLEALRRVIDSTPAEMLPGLSIRCRTDDLASLLTSPDRSARMLGIRLLAWAADDDAFVYKSVMDVLQSPEANHEEIAAALSSLRLSRRAHKLFRVADADHLRDLLSAQHRDVRVSAAKLLSEIRREGDIETMALISYAKAKRGADEYRPAVVAISKLANESEIGKQFLFSECERLLKKAGLNKEEADELRAVLSGFESIDGGAPEALIRALKKQAKSHRIDAEIRMDGLQAVAMLAPVDGATVDWILSTMTSPPAGTVSRIPAMVRTFVGRCRRRLEYLRMIHEHLPKLQDAVLSYHTRFSVVSSEYAETVIRDLRLTLSDIHYMMNSYDEFSRRAPPQASLPGVE